MMSINKAFSFKRFAKLVSMYALFNYKYWLIWLFSTIIVLGLFIFLNFVERLPNTSYVKIIYWGGYALLALILTSSAFPSFRQKEKSLHYLLIPNSTLEKYLFEVLRVIIPLALYPFIFWGLFEFDTFIAPYFYTYSAWQPDTWHLLDRIHIWNPANYHDENIIWNHGTGIMMVIAALSFAFLGTTIFRNKPTIKSLFILILFGGSLIGMFFLFTKGFGWEQYHLPYTGNWLSKSNLGGAPIILIGSVILTLASFISAYFNLKEKEL